MARGLDAPNFNKKNNLIIFYFKKIIFIKNITINLKIIKNFF